VPTIFVVDDDEMVLSSLRAYFSLSTDYAVACFSDPRRACAELGRTAADVVISDYLMPGLNGIDLLKEARQLQPDAARILLTGFADKENAIRAINEAGLYQYIEKPWDSEQLLIVVRNALQERSLRRELGEKVRVLDRLVREHSELAERHSHLEKDLAMAEQALASLLPSRMPAIDGISIDAFHRPCRYLGGDFYDFADDGERAALLLGDVSGHGAQAALICSLLKASFQEAAASACGPAELLAQMNATLFRFLPAGMYVAGAVLWLERREPGIPLSNAGLPYPFVLRWAEPRTDEIPIAGLPLGMFPGYGLEPYQVRPVHLEHGDVLLITSDGLGDVANRHGELFQDRELKRALSELRGASGSKLIEGLVERATCFQGEEPLPDDVTLVAVGRI